MAGGSRTVGTDALRMVADPARSLQVGDRMVGLITHIPKLKDEFEVQALSSWFWTAR